LSDRGAAFTGCLQRSKAQLLQTLADEAERGVLVTSDIHQKQSVNIPIIAENS
jgi:hypothetical protein